MFLLVDIQFWLVDIQKKGGKRRGGAAADMCNGRGRSGRGDKGFGQRGGRVRALGEGAGSGGGQPGGRRGMFSSRTRARERGLVCIGGGGPW
jgi:hypothetical protein